MDGARMVLGWLIGDPKQAGRPRSLERRTYIASVAIRYYYTYLLALPEARCTALFVCR